MGDRRAQILVLEPQGVALERVVTAAAVLGLMFPTPGGLGSYHVAVQLALTDVYAVARDTASGVALLAHAISFIPITILGITLFLLTRVRGQSVVDLAQPET